MDKAAYYSIIFITVCIFYQSRILGKNIKTDHSNSKYLAEDSLNIKSNESYKEPEVNWHQMLTNIPGDYYHFFKNTLDTKELPSLFAVSLLTGSLLAIDQGGWKYQQKIFKKVKFDRDISGAAITMGDGKYQLLSSALFASAGIIFNDKTALRTGSNIAEAVISTGLLVQVLKRITGRESPYASSESGGDWLFMPSIKEYQKNQPKYYSFPSGHLSTATAVVTVIANNYPNDKWIKPVGYSLLGILSFSLVNEGMHWYSDFPLAFLLGYTMGNIIAPAENNVNKSQQQSNTHLILSPSYSDNKIVLNAVYSF
jgi:membrane-associated phospholipid phosphatase